MLTIVLGMLITVMEGLLILVLRGLFVYHISWSILFIVLGEIDDHLLGGQLILDQKGMLTIVLEGMLISDHSSGKFADHSSWKVG